MKILVCGGRDFADVKPFDKDSKARKEHAFVQRTLMEIISKYSKYYDPNDNWLPTDIIIITGDARGVDTSAYDFAVHNYCAYKGYPADWNKFGKRAGPIRNLQMLDEEKPDLVVAFPGGKGTEHMVKIARGRGIKVKEIKYNEGE